MLSSATGCWSRPCSTRSAIRNLRGREVETVPVFSLRKQFFTRPHLCLIRVVGIIVPRRLRADWRQEWEAELRYRELLLAEWNNLNWKTKLDLLWRSLGAFRDALLLRPGRLEDKMFQDLRYGMRMLLKHKAS